MRLTAGLQPVTSPSSLSKMNTAEPEAVAPASVVPVIATTNGDLATGAPLTPPGYRVAVLVPLLATQMGLVALSARPQELTAFGSSTFGCCIGSSETWLIWVTRGGGPSSACAGLAANGKSRARAAPVAPRRVRRFTGDPPIDSVRCLRP